ncbi:MAG TPA: serine/threonine-protein kinase [Verrucomicrobiae bacterium]|nr:serine/threonine-protein kinase [Verrucomicrobiae bacterium]
MPTKIGHFEILSELAKSPTGAVYKANDPESGQTVALKAIQLSAFGENAGALEQALMAEVESTKAFSSPNITNVYGAGEMEGQFCAAMEYIQGNSIATMLARREGFTIWDLLDIGRQLCSGLDYAKSQGIVHYSLEPAKIMCGWDGTVKLLGYGMSSVGKFAHLVPEALSSTLYYMSPEQVQDQPMDARSNLFSLGAMFYEMVTERKAFDREDAESLRQSIVDSTPVAPVHVNPKVHPLLSDLIMKTLSKDPAERYQSGRELLDDLEKCKESKPAAAAKKAESAKGLNVPTAAKAAAQAKFVASARPAASPAAAKPAAPVARPVTPKPPVAPAPPKPPAAPVARSVAPSIPAPKPAPAVPKAAAAAASAGSGYSAPPADSSEVELDLSDSFIASSVKATIEPTETQPASMSAAVIDEPQVETFEPQAVEDGPGIAVDPMMAEGGQGGGGTSFSEISELPPLKESYIAPPPPPPPAETVPAPTPSRPTVYQGTHRREEKPKVQTREVAEKAIKEIKTVPPKLMMYALGGAGALILLIGIGVTYYIHGLNSDDDLGDTKTTAVQETPAQDATQPAQPAAQPAQSAPAPAAAQPEETQSEPDAAEPARGGRAHGSHRKAAPAAPVIIPGQMALDSTPQGAQVAVDGRTDPSYVTPFLLTSLQPGEHSITVSKAGYVTNSRQVNVASGTRATVVVHLSQLVATLVVSSDPAGASVYVDGRDTGVKTPAQVSVDKGRHVVLVRKMGYIDETMGTQFVLGQTFNFAPALRPLGNVDSIHTVGKMSRLFGGKGVQAGQATVSIHTEPKGAQVAINQHIMDKNSPLEIAVDPGNYVIDITLTGYAPVRKVITADKGGKIVIDETLQPQ